MLKRKKSVEIIISVPEVGVIVSSHYWLFLVSRVEFLKVLVASFTNKLSLSVHVEELLTKCSWTLFALKTLRKHGVAKVSFVYPAWSAYTNACDCERINAFLKCIVQSI